PARARGSARPGREGSPPEKRHDVAAQKRPGGDEAREDAERNGEDDAARRDRRGDAHEDERRVVAPLEEAVHDPLRGRGEENSEDRPRDGYEQPLDEDLQQDSPARESDEPQDPHRLTSLVGPHG